MASIPGISMRAALPAVIGAMALATACSPNSTTMEPTTWEGTLHLPAQAAKSTPVIYVKFDFDEFLSPDTEIVKLPLPGGPQVQIKKTGEESRDNKRLIWKGKIKGEKSSIVTLAASNGFLAGNIFTSKGKMYRVAQVDSGSLVIFEVDRSLFPAEAQPLVARQSIGAPSESSGPSASCPVDNAQNIEVMVVYTASACLGAVVGNTPTSCTPAAQQEIESNILTIKGETNTAFTESHAASDPYPAPQISLAHVGPVGEYTETNDLVEERRRLLLTGDDESTGGRLGGPYLDDVQQWRNQHGADVVVLVTRPAGEIADGPACGASTLMGVNKSWFDQYAYMVVPIDCMNLNQSFTHELGHLLGAGHQTPTPSQNSNFSDKNRAHVQLNPSKADVFAWRTVMAENDPACAGTEEDGLSTDENGCARILHFSNPAVEHEDDPTGSTAENNNEVISTTAGTVAMFRQALSCGNP